MSVRKRNNKWWVDFRFNRRRYRKPSPDNSRAGAVAYEMLLRQKLARGGPIDGAPENNKERITFKEFAEQWFEDYVKVNNKISEIRSKRSILNLYLLQFFGNLKIHEINSYKIERYKAERQRQGLSSKSINNTLYVLSKCLRTAQEWGILESIQRIKYLKVPPQKFDFLSIEESQRLLSYAEGKMKDLILFALHTGLRFGEIIALTWQDINIDERLVSVSRSVARGYLGSTKSNRIRHIPLSYEVIRMLQARRALGSKSILVFPNTKGKYLVQVRCIEWLHDICDKAGMRRIGWHTLRHTFASRLTQNGISIRTIQELLGHSDIHTTMRYSHLSPLILREAIRTLEAPRTINVGHNMVTIADSEEENGMFRQKEISANDKTKKQSVNSVLC